MIVELDRPVAHAVSRRPLTASVRVRSQASTCAICGGQSDTITGFSPSTSVFSSQNNSTSVPYPFAYHQHHMGLILETDCR
jgi:hypothetical protein